MIIRCLAANSKLNKKAAVNLISPRLTVHSLCNGSSIRVFRISSLKAELQKEIPGARYFFSLSVFLQNLLPGFGRD